MGNTGNRPSGIEVKIFDPRDGSTGLGGAELLDATVAQRGEQWWMYLAGTAPAETGLMWSRAATPSCTFSDWSQPVQIMTAEDRGWHSGPWKPSFQFDPSTGERALVFFDGLYRTSDPGPFPFAFTLGCFEVCLAAGIPLGHE